MLNVYSAAAPTRTPLCWLENSLNFLVYHLNDDFSFHTWLWERKGALKELQIENNFCK